LRAVPAAPVLSVTEKKLWTSPSSLAWLNAGDQFRFGPGQGWVVSTGGLLEYLAPLLRQPGRRAALAVQVRPDAVTAARRAPRPCGNPSDSRALHARAQSAPNPPADPPSRRRSSRIRSGGWSSGFLLSDPTQLLLCITVAWGRLIGAVICLAPCGRGVGSTARARGLYPLP